MRAQIAGVLAPDSPAEVYRRAIRTVLAGEIWLPRAVLEVALQPLAKRGAPCGSGQAGAAARARPTPLEAEVSALLQQGLSNKVITRHLDISPETVKKCLAILYRKAGVSSRGYLIAWMLG